MEVHGQLRAYSVVWSRKGWHKAEPVVRVARTVPLLNITVWRPVWTGDVIPLDAARRMLPGPMTEWFKKAVDDFESYEIAWSQHDA